jgi:hypothetical protein
MILLPLKVISFPYLIRTYDKKKSDQLLFLDMFASELGLTPLPRTIWVEILEIYLLLSNLF